MRIRSNTILAALREHTWLTARAVLIAALVALPLAVAAYWFRSLAAPIVALTGVLYTIPSLALFAFLAPYLGIGAITVLTVVALYALLVIVRNALAGLNQVPSEVREAAEGMGYGRWGRLLRIELPLALPGILTGTIIGMARALGETAPLLMIGMRAFIASPPGGVTDPATVLPVQIFLWSDEVGKGFVEKTSAAIIVLLLFLLTMNGLAIYLRNKFEKRW